MDLRAYNPRWGADILARGSQRRERGINRKVGKLALALYFLLVTSLSKQQQNSPKRKIHPKTFWFCLLPSTGDGSATRSCKHLRMVIWCLKSSSPTPGMNHGEGPLPCHSSYRSMIITTLTWVRLLLNRIRDRGPSCGGRRAQSILQE